MQKFSLIVEKDDVDKKLSGKNGPLKRKFLESVEWNTIEDLKKLLTENIKGFKNEIPVSIAAYSNIEDIYSFWQNNMDLVDVCLDGTEWFNEIPKTSGINSVKQYCIESTKFALGQVCQEIVDDLTVKPATV